LIDSASQRQKELDFPNAPYRIPGEFVTLVFNELKPGNDEKGYVPYYHFKIFDKNHVNVGHINFRVGETDHIKYCAGHIGYEVKEIHRGNLYAYYACTAIAPFVRQFYKEVLLTVDPNNLASIRTIEKLGSMFIDKVSVAESEKAYKKGSIYKLRYIWHP